MRHSKTFKREDGTTVEIAVSLTLSLHQTVWDVMVFYKEKRKRNFIHTFWEHDSNLRGLSREEIDKRRLAKQLEYCTLEEIQEVKKELRDKIPLD